MSIVEIDPADFMSSLRGIAELTQERWGILCRVSPDHDLVVGDEDVATQLLRIAQEALHNAAKHAQAVLVAAAALFFSLAVAGGLQSGLAGGVER